MQISVIMPCYCSSGTLERSVRSLQAQSFPDWELVAVDDGSPENDYELLCRLAKEDPRIRAFRQENGGVSSARNRGIREAGGEWLFFLDADDYLTEGAFERLLKNVSAEEDIVCGAYEIRYRDSGEKIVSTCSDGGLQTVMESLIRGDSALNSMCARLYRASFIRQNSICADTKLAIGEDVLFNLAAFLHARAWKIQSDVVYIYDYGGNSAMVKARKDVYGKSLPMLFAIGCFLRENGLCTRFFRAHIDVWLRMLRADRGRFAAALEYGKLASGEVIRDVQPARLSTAKEKLYYWALRIFPFSSILLP